MVFVKPNCLDILTGNWRLLRVNGCFDSVGVVGTQPEVPLVHKGPTTRSGSIRLRAGFAKAIQDMLDQDKSGHKQLLIEEMGNLKIEDQAESNEVQVHPGPIQFKSFDQYRPGSIISTFDLGSLPSDSDP